MKNIITFILALFIGACSTTSMDTSTTPDTSAPDTSIPDILEEMNKKYPYLSIKLEPFEVNDVDSSSAGATEEENAKARRIDSQEKYYMLKNLDLLRFVINTPEFATELLLPCYLFRVAEDATGAFGTVTTGEFYDPNRLLTLIKNASITTFIKKYALSDGAAAAKLGPPFYVDIDPQNPAQGNWDRGDLLIMFPNYLYWADSETPFGKEFPGNIAITASLFHELIHNLGFSHVKEDQPKPKYDTAYMLQDIFRIVASSREWQEKYTQELHQYNYYQTKYKDWLTFTTTPNRR